jgi:hypothetical protein
MNNWIDLHALWRIVVVGIVCGAGLPALFAVGLRILSVAQPAEATAGGSGRPGRVGGTATVSRNPVNLVAAGVCFAVILAAIGWGIYLIVAGT